MKLNTDRFDLEQQIMQCWGITEDLEAIIRQYDYNSPSEDDMMNVLIGLQTLYNLKFNRLFNTFETLIQEKKIL